MHDHQVYRDPSQREDEQMRNASHVSSRQPKRDCSKNEGTGHEGSCAEPSADWAAHRRLAPTLKALAAIEGKRNDSSRDAQLAIEALAVVIELIEADKPSWDANAAGPLWRLQVALHDMLQGSSPALLSRPPGQAGPVGRIINTTSDGIRGMLAAAVDALIEEGLSRRDAGASVARQTNLHRLPIAGIGDKGVTAQAVLRWRDEAPIAKSEAFKTTYELVRKEVAKIRDHRGGRLGQAAAKIVLESMIEAGARTTT